jgi:hypothetical protein
MTADSWRSSGISQASINENPHTLRPSDRPMGHRATSSKHLAGRTPRSPSPPKGRGAPRGGRSAGNGRSFAPLTHSCTTACCIARISTASSTTHDRSVQSGTTDLCESSPQLHRRRTALGRRRNRYMAPARRHTRALPVQWPWAQLAPRRQAAPGSRRPPPVVYQRTLAPAPRQPIPPALTQQSRLSTLS